MEISTQVYENLPTVYDMEAASDGNITMVAHPRPLLDRGRYVSDPYCKTAVPSGVDRLCKAVEYREKMMQKGCTALADCTIKVSEKDSYGIRRLTAIVWGDRDHLKKIKACSSYMLTHPECTDIEDTDILVALSGVTRIQKSLPNWFIQKEKKKKASSSAKKANEKKVEEEDIDVSEWCDDDDEEYLDD